MTKVITAEDVRQAAYAFAYELGQARDSISLARYSVGLWTEYNVDKLDAETVRVLEAWQAMQKVLVAYQAGRREELRLRDERYATQQQAFDAAIRAGGGEQRREKVGIAAVRELLGCHLPGAEEGEQR